jgi:hypothetical protein
MSLSEGSGSEILGEKPRSSAAFCLLEKSKSPPPKEGGVPHYLESQHPHSQLKQISTYTRIHASTQQSFSSFRSQLAVCPPVLARGNAVVGPLGRAAPWLVQ